MVDIGYYAQIEGGIFGQPDGTDDPVSRAALQEAAIQANILRASQPGTVPPSYVGAAAVGPSWSEMGGPSNLPKVGWTAQNSGGSSAFVTPPDEWEPTDMGRVPDWTATEGNSVAAGSYDQNEVYTGAFAYDRDATAPRGDGLLQYEDVLNPNRPPNDVGGTEGELDY